MHDTTELGVSVAVLIRRWREPKKHFWSAMPIWFIRLKHTF